MSNDTFIQKAKTIHGDKYRYDKVEYINTHTPVVITCPIHGDFNQRPVKHTSQRCGCPRCGKSVADNAKRHTKHDFTKKAKTIHGDKYRYDKVEYVNNHTPVTITCPIHGDFEQLPVKHTSQRCGCPRCSLTSSTEDFITKSNAVHEGKYLYDKVIYQSSHQHVTIQCPTHGAFDCTPNNHLQGYGCPKCGGTGGYNMSTLSGTELGAAPGLLYFISMSHDGVVYYKVGVTKHTVHRRFPGKTINILATRPGTLYEVYSIEQNIINKHRNKRYCPPELKGNGSTECFKLDDIDVQTIIQYIVSA